MKEVYKKTILENGIRVVTERIDYVRSLSIGIWIDVGSRDEENDEVGISHFIEHMLFKGTKKRTAKEIASSLESVGGALNAFTGREHTCYIARVLDEHLDIALDVLSDILKNPLLNPSHFEKKRGDNFRDKGAGRFTGGFDSRSFDEHHVEGRSPGKTYHRKYGKCA